MTAPAGCMSLAQEYLRITLANSATFQALVEHVDDVDSTKESIYHEGLPAPADGDAYTAAELEAYRPYAVVSTREEQGFGKRRDALGAFVDSGFLMLEIVRTSPEDLLDDRAELDLTWRNIIGQILDELEALAGTAGMLDIKALNLVAGPDRMHPDPAEAQGDTQFATVEVHW